MKKIILISCCKSKECESAIAEELYIGTFFKLAYRYAKKLHPDKILFLSTEYHVIEPTETKKRVNKDPEEMSKDEWQDWSNKVLKQLKDKEHLDLQNDYFLFLAYRKYWDGLVQKDNLQRDKNKIQNFETPLKGLGRLSQLVWLKNALEE